ncbi:hypothetical protein [Myroides phaeus]|uniref:hypothetical protein n=1 Tax=Myroides phaeus TaxID=702745 RepID=UPI001303C2DC|nr:hypothetical protein [Myroides phaeus]
MKLTKLFSAFAICVFLLTSCSNDDSNEPIRVDQKDQQEIGKELPFKGEFIYAHSGMPIPFTFEKNSITMNMSQMAGSGQDDDKYNILTVYKNKEGVLKVVTKHEKESQYKAFFLRNIKDESLDINIDYTFKSEIEAIKTNYPSKAGGALDHANNQFGWLLLTKKSSQSTPINLPVNGKYVFTQGQHSYYYNFTNETVNFNGSYDMKVLAHNTSTNKILLQGVDTERKDFFYIIQLKNIKENNVDIARATFNEGETKKLAEKEFAGIEELKNNFTTYTKEDKTGTVVNLKGTYGSAIIKDKETGKPQAQYVFKVGEGTEAFLFRADMGSGFGDSASFTLKKVATDEKKGQLIYEITGSTGYYAGRTGQFLTIYFKDISANGNKATFAIATKNGKNSVSSSQGDVIGKTIEEAKAIKAPEANLVWENDMMKYAHLWILTTKE